VSLLIRPDVDDLRLVSGYLGLVLLGVAALHVPAIAVAVALGETDDVSAMAVGAALAALVGLVLQHGLRHGRELDWAHGLVTVALAWLVAPLPIAASLLLSGHFGSFLDAWFEALSGLTTSGLSLAQDLDHLGVGMNLLRHLTHFAGGQGIILVVLTVLTAGGSQAGTLLAGEGREERLVPSVIRTARLIYTIALAWLLAGTTALFVALQLAGFTPWRALFHAATLFMAAFDTGGFSPNSTSVAYYHAASVEGVLVVLMLAGAISFPLHYVLWQRRIGTALRYLDLRTYALTTSLLTTVLVVGLGAHQAFTTVGGLARKGVFTAISGATGTGFAVVPATAYASWGQLAPGALVGMMLIGAMAGSTAGGIKTIRIGLIGKSVLRDLRKALLPASGVAVASYRDRRVRVISDEQVSGAVVVTVLFLLTAVGGALVYTFHGATLEEGLFESTSALAAVGLSVGLTSPGEPTVLKVLAMSQMWLGRLEFLPAFALVGYLLALVRGTRAP
jgi:trk system potassium uptake protein TrkH